MGQRGPRPTTRDAKKHVGSIEIQKGQTAEGIPVVTWDAIIPCEDEKCPITEHCPYEHAGRCRVRKEYIAYVQKLLLGQVDKEKEMVVFRIGMELIPLFNQLIDIKIHSYGKRPVYVTDKGNYAVQPLLKELRACLKAISDCLSNLSDGFSGGVKGMDDLVGDTGYYEKLFNGENQQKEFKMRNRV